MSKVYILLVVLLIVLAVISFAIRPKRSKPIASDGLLQGVVSNAHNFADLTSYTIQLGRVPVSGKIEQVSIESDCKAGSPDPVHLYLIQNGTNYLAYEKLPLSGEDIVFRPFQTVAEGDRLSVKIITPAWLTNPVDWKITTVRIK